MPATPADALPDRRASRVVKRGIDLFIGLLVVVPLMASAVIAGLLILLVDRHRPWYIDPRVGLGGRRFPCLKLQTLRPDPNILERHFQKHPLARVQYERERKLDVDPRVTNLGQVLRKLSVDEFPQILNVLIGHMSLVGPRPLAPGESQLRGTLAESLTWVRPGLTGPWQINGRSSLSPEERARLDDFYARNWSLALDFRILAKTPWAVLRGRGAR